MSSSENHRRVADYFVVAGLPKENPQLLDEYSLEVNLKPSAYQDPITDITVIIPSLGENVPDYYQLIDGTPSGLSANLNHGSFRAPEVFLCYRRGRDRPPLVDIGVLYDGKERVLPDSQIVEFTINGHSANVNNTTNSSTYLTYRRATEISACNELVVMDLCIIIASKGETPPHSFMKIDKTLNKGVLGSDVYICYKKSMNRADLVAYKPGILSRFPLSDNSKFPLEETVALFCLPMGATLECWPANSVRSNAVYSTFVLTLASREKVYGSAITFYEEYDENSLTEEQKSALELTKYRQVSDRKIFSNKCICILSQWPFFEAFQKFLFFLYKRQLMGPHDIPLERYISHFLYDVPFPSITRPRILVQLSGDDRIALFQPEELPLPRSGASFRHLLTNLGPDNCLLLLLLAVTEQKILIHSLRPHVLTSVAEAVMQIIFPFYWQCPYIPLCPIGMSDYLAAPLPFVIGLDSRFFDLYDQPTDVNAIDLDTNTVTVCKEKHGLSAKILPKRASRYLRNRLVTLQEKCWFYENLAQKLEAQNDGAIDFDFKMKEKEMELEMEIREAFLHFMVSILAGYKHFLLPITKAPTVGATDVGNLFDQQNFLRSRDRNFYRFYEMVMKTQMFTKFIEERSFVSETNAFLAFFDECVERAEHEENPKFLELETFDSDRTVFILPPDISDLPQDKEYKYEKFEDLDSELYPEKHENDYADSGSGDYSDTPKNSVFSTPGSALAKRTKQEIRSAQKSAKKHAQSPYMWAKCLVNTCYSIWFIHLSSFIIANSGKPSILRLGLTLLQRMQRLRLHPADEICYRVMMQLCGVYNQPVMAVKVLFEMKRIGLHPNAVTYGYYNKAVLESEWPSNMTNSSQLLWNKLRNVILAVSIFKECGKSGLLKKTLKLNGSKTSGEEEGEQQQLQQSDDNVSRTSEESKDSKDTLVTPSKAIETLTEEIEEEVVIGDDTALKEDDDNDDEVDMRRKKSKDNNDENERSEKSRSIIVRTSSSNHDQQNDSHLTSPKSTNEIESASEANDQSGLLDDSVTEGIHPICSDTPSKSPRERHDKYDRGISFNDHNSELGVTKLADLKMDALGQDKDILNHSKVQQEQENNLELKLTETSTPTGTGSTARVKYSDIRGKFSNLFSKSVDSNDVNKKQGPNRALFRTESQESSSKLEQQVRDFMEQGSRGPSAARSLSEEKSLSQSVDSMDLDGGGGDNSFPRSLYKVNNTSSGHVPKSPNIPMKSPMGAGGGNTVSPMYGTPVTENDPLGALSPQTSPANTMHKSSTLDGASGHSKQDLLGEPFGGSSRNMTRSSTLPTPLDSDSGNSASSSITTSMSSIAAAASSWKKTGFGGKLSNLKKGSSLLTSYLSPSPATAKKTQDALKTSMDTLREKYSQVSKKFEEYQTQSYSEEGSVRTNDDDNISQTSTDSRRQSEANVIMVNDQSDTWSSLTEELWDKIWGTGSGGGGSKSNSLPNQMGYPHTKVSDITDQFENLYLKLPKSPPGPVAMEILMTSCSRCLYCNQMLFDEEIMSGWTPEDSNLNTKCQFCGRLLVPFLTIRVVDYRTRPLSIMASLLTPAPSINSLTGSVMSLHKVQQNQGDTGSQTSTSAKQEVVSEDTKSNDSKSNDTKSNDDKSTSDNSKSKEKDNQNTCSSSSTNESSSSSNSCRATSMNNLTVTNHPLGELTPPVVSDTFTVPYLSPLVLRKELESILEREGDCCLNTSACVDDHPIIFWNLLWYFERIAVPSHLPCLCLTAKSLNADDTERHSSWSAANQRNVHIKCKWDNERLHEETDLPLYTKWKGDENLAQDSDPTQLTIILNEKKDMMTPLMHQIITGVQNNDLLHPIKSLIDERKRFGSTPGSPPKTDLSSPSSPLALSPSGKPWMSVYRNILFLTLISLGQENIDLTAFDREYRRAFEKLPAKYQSQYAKYDMPPNLQTVFCRKFFRELNLV